MALMDADKFDFSLIAELRRVDSEPNGVLRVLPVVYYTDHPDRGEPYASGLMGYQVFTDKCDWPQEDKDFFENWINSEPIQNEFKAIRQDIEERLTKAAARNSFKGILDD
jgi:hypothetical protein